MERDDAVKLLCEAAARVMAMQNRLEGQERLQLISDAAREAAEAWVGTQRRAHTVSQYDFEKAMSRLCDILDGKELRRGHKD